MAVVVEQHARGEARLRQRLEQVALARRRVVQRLVLGLAAGRAQHADRRRAAVAGRRAEIGEQEIEALQQRVVARARHVEVVP
ncbi:hypothetical protein D3C80_1948780 [compost metagenome]